eukprot:CFRG6778T1
MGMRTFTAQVLILACLVAVVTGEDVTKANTIQKNDATVNCVYHDAVTNTDYDFSVLHRTQSVNWHAHDTRENKENHFHLNVCGPLINAQSKGQDAAHNCEGAAACMVRENKSKAHAAHGAEAHPTKSLGLPSPPTMVNQTLVFNYKGGTSCRGGKFERETLIFMRCGPTLGAPVFLLETPSCQFQFLWTTSAACGVGHTPDETTCTAYDPNLEIEYDLTDLRIDQPWELSDGTTIFYLSVCQPLSQVVPCVVKDPSASLGACAVKKITGPDGPVNEMLNIGVYDNRLSRPEVHNGHVSITYHTTRECPKPSDASDTDPAKHSKVLIQFVCKRGDIGEPVYIRKTQECTYKFIWETYVACGVADDDSDDDQVSINDAGVAMTMGKCRVEDPVTKQVFDLSGLTALTDYIIKGPQGYNYWMQICQPLRDIHVCGEVGTSVCRHQISGSSGTLGETLPMGDMHTSELELADGILTLTYLSNVPCEGGQNENGDGQNMNVSSTILFRCDREMKDHEGSGPQILAGTTPDDCTATFEWITPLACGQPTETTQCVVEDSDTGIVYDFSSLKSRDFNWVANGRSDNTTGSSAGNYDYFISVCGAVERTGAAKECGALSSVCRVSKDGTNAIGMGHVAVPKVEEGGVIQVKYNGGDECQPGRWWRTIVTFVCDRGHIHHPPKFVRESVRDCVTEFEWFTSAACPPAEWTYGLDCKVKNPYSGYQYDLNPLSRPKTGYITAGDSHFFAINICETLENAATGTACSNHKDTAICETDEKSVVGKVNRTVGYKDEVLMMTFENGNKCKDGKSRKSIITFVCDHKSMGYPVFVEEEDDCSYWFEWHTAAACERPRDYELACYAVDLENEQIFDLSSLQSHPSDYVSMDENDGREFHLSVCRPLNRIPVGCLPGSSVCSHYPKDETTVGQAEGFFAHPPTVVDGVISLLYTGGAVCTDLSSVSGAGIVKGDVITGDLHATNATLSSTLITFTCREGPDGVPVFVGKESGCRYLFEWPTPAACGQGKSTIKGSDCRVRSANSPHVYDLSTLKSQDGYSFTTHWLEDNTTMYTNSNVIGSGGVFGMHIRINICDPLKKGCGASGDAWNDAAVCVTDATSTTIGTGPAHETLGGRQNSELKEVAPGILTLTMTDGDPCPTNVEIPIQTAVTFVCDAKGSDGYGNSKKPMLTRVGDCVYEFTWPTALACTTSENDDCMVVSEKGEMYDLSPLRDVRFDWVTPGLSDTTGVHLTYHIAVCRSMLTPNDPKDPLYECRGNDDITSAVVDDRKCHILTSGSTPSPLVIDEGVLVYKVTGQEKCEVKERGQNVQRNKTTMITLTCIHGTMGFPVHVGGSEDGCEIRFEWATEAACEVKVVSGKECSVRSPVNDQVFDLTDLYNPQTDYHIIGDMRETYYINPCNGVVDMKHCPTNVEDSTGVCMTYPVQTNSKPVSFGRNENGEITWNDGLVVMQYKDGSVCTSGSTEEKFSATIMFTCSRGDEIGSPKMVKPVGVANTCAKVFEWPTEKVCETETWVQCTAVDTVSGVLYDLSILGSMRKNWETVDDTDDSTVESRMGASAQTHTNHHKKRRFHLNVCKGLNPIFDDIGDVSVSANGEVSRKSGSCWRHAAACMQIDDSAFFNLGSAVFAPTATNGVMKITYTDGQLCPNMKNGKTSTVITFVCKLGGLGAPRFVGETDNCVYQFLWETELMCERKSDLNQVSDSDDCKLLDPSTGTLYDLNPLRTKDGISVSTSSAMHVHHKHVLNVCGSVSSDACAQGTGVCQTDSQTSLGKASSRLTTINGVVSLVYKGGEKCPDMDGNGIIRYKESTIAFICETDESVGMGHPIAIESEDECSYFFEWRTPLGCANTFKEVQCTVVVEDEYEDVEYDLSSLTRSDKDWEAVTAGRDDSFKYYFNVCKPLVEQHSTCPAGAAICRVRERNGQVVQTENLGNPTSAPIVEDGVVTLTYVSDELCYRGHMAKNKTSTITFICDEQSGELGTPVFTGRSLDCENAFEWKTSHACPISSSSSINVGGGDHLSTTKHGSCVYYDAHMHAEYDLNGLRPTGHMHRYVTFVDSVRGIKYHMNVCGKVVSSTKNIECEGGGVCMVGETADGKTKPVNMGTPSADVLFTNGVLSLKYENGDICDRYPGRNRTSQILFTCNKHAGIGRPIMTLNDNDCSVTFLWETVFACSNADESVECAFHSTYSGLPYDLSALTKADGAWEVIDPASSYKYYINVCRGISNIAGAEGCAVNSGACQIDSNDFAFKPKNLGHVISRPRVNNEGVVELKYEHGTLCHNHYYHRSTTILFECDENAGQGAPQFVLESAQCEYIFRWKSKAACPIPTTTVIDHSEACKIVHPITGHTYDLNPLSVPGSNNNADENGEYKFGRDGYMYHLSICKPLKDLHGCPQGTSFCQTKSRNSDINGEYHKAIGYVTKSSLMFAGGSVSMVLAGGADCAMQVEGFTVKKSVIIHFVCDTSNGPGRPVLYKVKNSCEYTLEWKTDVVCYNPDLSVHENEEACKPITVGADGHKYDLSLLSDKYMEGFNNDYGGWEVVMSKDVDQMNDRFYISVCDALSHGVCGEDNVGVCRIRGDGTHEVVGVTTGQKLSVSTDGIVQLLYTSNTPCTGGDGTKTVSTLIQFTCIEKSIRPPQWISYTQSTCTHNVEWKTMAACMEIEQTGSGCAVTSATGHIYSLKALMKPAGVAAWTSEAEDQLTHTKTIYHLNVCGPLEDEKSGTDSGKASPGSGAYDMTNKFNLGVANDEVRLNYNQLVLTYSDGDKCVNGNGAHVKARTVITFTCMHMHDEGDLGAPVFVTKTPECSFMFEWETPLACEFPNEAVFGIKHGSNNDPGEPSIKPDVANTNVETSSDNEGRRVTPRVLLMILGFIAFASTLYGMSTIIRRKSQNNELAFSDLADRLARMLGRVGDGLPTMFRSRSRRSNMSRYLSNNHDDDFVELLDVSSDEDRNDHDMFMDNTLGIGKGQGFVYSSDDSEDDELIQG